MSGFSDQDRPVKNTFDSGGFRESTGREPFENANTQGATTGATGVTTGLQGNTGQSGLTRDLRDTHPNDPSAGQNLGGFSSSERVSGSDSYGQHDRTSHGQQNTQIGDSYGSAASDNTRYQDRTGDLQQDAHKYEGRGGAGPRTGGAAGTDRFDSSSHGDSYGARDTYPTGTDSKTSDPGDRNNDGRDERIVGGTMGGSNKPMGEKIKDGLTRHGDDFTKTTGARGGAYADTGAKFQDNTSGPGGDANRALTGREGNYRENPVSGSNSNPSGAPARSGVAEGHDRSSTTDNNPHANDGHKPGLVEKVKEVFHK